MSKDQRRAQTKKALLDALVICLEDQDFNDITTIRLVQTAGISRSSFYTHYKDKYEMIDSYQKELFHKLEYIFDKYEGKKEGAFLEIFEFLTREKLLSALLSTNGSKEIQDFLIHKLQRMIAEDFIDPTAEERDLKGFEKDYASIYFAHAIFGACQAWINKGKKESPQEMTDFLLRFIPQYNNFKSIKKLQTISIVKAAFFFYNKILKIRE